MSNVYTGLMHSQVKEKKKQTKRIDKNTIKQIKHILEKIQEESYVYNEYDVEDTNFNVNNIAKDIKKLFSNSEYEYGFHIENLGDVKRLDDPMFSVTEFALIKRNKKNNEIVEKNIGIFGIPESKLKIYSRLIDNANLDYSSLNRSEISTINRLVYYSKLNLNTMTIEGKTPSFFTYEAAQKGLNNLRTLGESIYYGDEQCKKLFENINNLIKKANTNDETILTYDDKNFDISVKNRAMKELGIQAEEVQNHVDVMKLIRLIYDDEIIDTIGTKNKKLGPLEIIAKSLNIKILSKDTVSYINLIMDIASKLKIDLYEKLKRISSKPKNYITNETSNNKVIYLNNSYKSSPYDYIITDDNKIKNHSNIVLSRDNFYKIDNIKQVSDEGIDKIYSNYKILNENAERPDTLFAATIKNASEDDGSEYVVFSESKEDFFHELQRKGKVYNLMDENEIPEGISKKEKSNIITQKQIEIQRQDYLADQIRITVDSMHDVNGKGYIYAEKMYRAYNEVNEYVRGKLELKRDLNSKQIDTLFKEKTLNIHGRELKYKELKKFFLNSKENYIKEWSDDFKNMYGYLSETKDTFNEIKKHIDKVNFNTSDLSEINFKKTILYNNVLKEIKSDIKKGLKLIYIDVKTVIENSKTPIENKDFISTIHKFNADNIVENKFPKEHPNFNEFRFFIINNEKNAIDISTKTNAINSLYRLVTNGIREETQLNMDMICKERLNKISDFLIENHIIDYTFKNRFIKGTKDVFSIIKRLASEIYNYKNNLINDKPIEELQKFYVETKNKIINELANGKEIKDIKLSELENYVYNHIPNNDKFNNTKFNFNPILEKTYDQVVNEVIEEDKQYIESLVMIKQSFVEPTFEIKNFKSDLKEMDIFKNLLTSSLGYSEENIETLMSVIYKDKNSYTNRGYDVSFVHDTRRKKYNLIATKKDHTKKAIERIIHGDMPIKALIHELPVINKEKIVPSVSRGMIETPIKKRINAYIDNLQQSFEDNNININITDTISDIIKIPRTAAIRVDELYDSGKFEQANKLINKLATEPIVTEGLSQPITLSMISKNLNNIQIIEKIKINVNNQKSFMKAKILNANQIVNITPYVYFNADESNVRTSINEIFGEEEAEKIMRKWKYKLKEDKCGEVEEFMDLNPELQQYIQENFYIHDSIIKEFLNLDNINYKTKKTLQNLIGYNQLTSESEIKGFNISKENLFLKYSVDAYMSNSEAPLMEQYFNGISYSYGELNEIIKHNLNMSPKKLEKEYGIIIGENRTTIDFFEDFLNNEKSKKDYVEGFTIKRKQMTTRELIDNLNIIENNLEIFREKNGLEDYSDEEIKRVITLYKSNGSTYKQHGLISPVFSILADKQEIIQTDVDPEFIESGKLKLEDKIDNNIVIGQSIINGETVNKKYREAPGTIKHIDSINNRVYIMPEKRNFEEINLVESSVEKGIYTCVFGSNRTIDDRMTYLSQLIWNEVIGKDISTVSNFEHGNHEAGSNIYGRFLNELEKKADTIDMQNKIVESINKNFPNANARFEERVFKDNFNSEEYRRRILLTNNITEENFHYKNAVFNVVNEVLPNPYEFIKDLDENNIFTTHVRKSTLLDSKNLKGTEESSDKDSKNTFSPFSIFGQTLIEGSFKEDEHGDITRYADIISDYINKSALNSKESSDNLNQIRKILTFGSSISGAYNDALIKEIALDEIKTINGRVNSDTLYEEVFKEYEFNANGVEYDVLKVNLPEGKSIINPFSEEKEGHVFLPIAKNNFINDNEIYLSNSNKITFELIKALQLLDKESNNNFKDAKELEYRSNNLYKQLYDNIEYELNNKNGIFNKLIIDKKNPYSSTALVKEIIAPEFNHDGTYIQDIANKFVVKDKTGNVVKYLNGVISTKEDFEAKGIDFKKLGEYFMENIDELDESTINILKEKNIINDDLVITPFKQLERLKISKYKEAHEYNDKIVENYNIEKAKYYAGMHEKVTGEYLKNEGLYSIEYKDSAISTTTAIPVKKYLEEDVLGSRGDIYTPALAKAYNDYVEGHKTVSIGLLTKKNGVVVPVAKKDNPKVIDAMDNLIDSFNTYTNDRFIPDFLENNTKKVHGKYVFGTKESNLKHGSNNLDFSKYVLSLNGRDDINYLTNKNSILLSLREAQNKTALSDVSYTNTQLKIMMNSIYTNVGLNRANIKYSQTLGDFINLTEQKILHSKNSKIPNINTMYNYMEKIEKISKSNNNKEMANAFDYLLSTLNKSGLFDEVNIHGKDILKGNYDKTTDDGKYIEALHDLFGTQERRAVYSDILNKNHLQLSKLNYKPSDDIKNSIANVCIGKYEPKSSYGKIKMKIVKEALTKQAYRASSGEYNNNTIFVPKEVNDMTGIYEIDKDSFKANKNGIKQITLTRKNRKVQHENINDIEKNRIIVKGNTFEEASENVRKIFYDTNEIKENKINIKDLLNTKNTNASYKYLFHMYSVDNKHFETTTKSMSSELQQINNELISKRINKDQHKSLFNKKINHFSEVFIEKSNSDSETKKIPPDVNKKKFKNLLGDIYNDYNNKEIIGQTLHDIKNLSDNGVIGQDKIGSILNDMNSRLIKIAKEIGVNNIKDHKYNDILHSALMYNKVAFNNDDKPLLHEPKNDFVNNIIKKAKTDSSHSSLDLGIIENIDNIKLNDINKLKNKTNDEIENTLENYNLSKRDYGNIKDYLTKKSNSNISKYTKENNSNITKLEDSLSKLVSSDSKDAIEYLKHETATRNINILNNNSPNIDNLTKKQLLEGVEDAKIIFSEHANKSIKDLSIGDLNCLLKYQTQSSDEAIKHSIEDNKELINNYLLLLSNNNLNESSEVLSRQTKNNMQEVKNTMLNTEEINEAIKKMARDTVIESQDIKETIDIVNSDHHKKIYNPKEFKTEGKIISGLATASVFLNSLNNEVNGNTISQPAKEDNVYNESIKNNEERIAPSSFNNNAVLDSGVTLRINGRGTKGALDNISSSVRDAISNNTKSLYIKTKEEEDTSFMSRQWIKNKIANVLK